MMITCDEYDKKTVTKTHQSQPRSPQWTRSQQTDYFRLKDDLGEVEIFSIKKIKKKLKIYLAAAPPAVGPERLGHLPPHLLALNRLKVETR